MLNSATNFAKELNILGLLFSDNNRIKQIEMKSSDNFLFRCLIDEMFDVLF